MGRKAKIDIKVGDRYGRLTVIEKIGSNKYYQAMWLCKCDCGNETVIRGYSLTQGKSKSCGKCKEPKVGNTYGRLTIIKRVENNKYGIHQWLCRCACGNETIVSGYLLVSGNTKSCGCYNREIHTGENNSNYNPNLTDEEREKRRNIKGYGKFINTVLKRDNYTCQCCGEHCEEVHHLDGYNWCKEKRTDVNNGISLCNKCHKVFHIKYGSRNNTKEQFKEFLAKYYGKELDGTTVNKECEEIPSYDILIDAYPNEKFETVKYAYDFLKKLGYKINSKSTLKSYINGNAPMSQELYDLGLHRADKKMEDYKVLSRESRIKVSCEGNIFQTIKECAEYYKVSPTTISPYLTGSKKMPEKWKNLNLCYVTEDMII